MSSAFQCLRMNRVIINRRRPNIIMLYQFKKLTVLNEARSLDDFVLGFGRTHFRKLGSLNPPSQKVGGGGYPSFPPPMDEGDLQCSVDAGMMHFPSPPKGHFNAPPRPAIFGQVGRLPSPAPPVPACLGGAHILRPYVDVCLFSYRPLYRAQGILLWLPGHRANTST